MRPFLGPDVSRELSWVVVSRLVWLCKSPLDVHGVPVSKLLAVKVDPDIFQGLT